MPAAIEQRLNARNLVLGAAAGVVAGVLALVYGPITWAAAFLFVVLSGVLMPRWAYLTGALVALGVTWLTLMLVLNTPRPFLVVPAVLIAGGFAFGYMTFIRKGHATV